LLETLKLYQYAHQLATKHLEQFSIEGGKINPHFNLENGINQYSSEDIRECRG
jgi:hypothetical protein